MRDWQLTQFVDKNVVFVGAGRGRAMTGIQQLLEQYAAIKSFVGVDKHDNEIDPLAFLKEYNPAQTIFIKNEGIPGHELSVPYTTPLQLFFQLVPTTKAITIGITGTKGKSTTTALTAHILEAAGKQVVLAGNNGISPFPALDTATADTIFVFELSSYQLSDVTMSPHISACLNLYNDHSDWHTSRERYWEAKHNIMRFAGKDDVFIYNPEYPALREWAEAAHCQTKAIDTTEMIDMKTAELFGEHNRLNALIAKEICLQCNVTDDVFQAAVNTFHPLEHRMQLVADTNGRTYIDDAIGMTPESTIASMRAIREKFGPIGCLLLGGQNRSYDFTDLMHYIAHEQVPYLVMFPNTEAAMRAAMPDGYKPTMLDTSSMKEAVNFAASHAPAGSVVLLSTAAPSYLLWSGFEEKGKQFQAAVAALGARD